MTTAVVACGAHVGIRKNFRGDKVAFLNELRALHTLGLGKCLIPAIMDIDFDSLTLTYSYILGSVLREELGKRGAVVRDRDVPRNLSRAQGWRRRLEEGK